MNLHKKTYLLSKEKTHFNSQTICDIERNVSKCKGTRLEAITVKFNVPRNCKTFTTRTRFFVEFGLYPHKRVAIPLRDNRNMQRYRHLITSGWICKTYGLASDGQVVAFLHKDGEAKNRRNVLGVDVNSKSFALTILTPEGKVVKQLYLGKDIWTKRNRIMLRRDRLRSLSDQGSHRARRSLQQLRRREQNFVKNRIGEVVRDITNLALQHDADIAIEELKRFKPKGRTFNRQVLRMPIFQFKRTLQSRCFDKSMNLTLLDPYHTSKWCSHCGAVARKGHAENYALFKCVKCGQVVNSDRKASLAIAVKALLARKTHDSNQAVFFQFASRRVPVSGLLRSNEIDGSNSAVHSKPSMMESPCL
jgi:IS605 OrfB family transposase